MLKVERGKKNQVLVKIKKKENFFNSLLGFSFLLAFIFHAVFLIFFSIVSFDIENHPFLPPVFVETDWIKFESTAYADVEITERKLHRLTPFIKHPKMASFPYPELSLIDEQTQDENQQNKEVSSLDNPYFCYEKELQYEVFFKEQSEKKKSVVAMLRNDVDRDFIESSLQPLLDGLENIHAIYEIKVENKTGRIFWMEPKLAIDEKQHQKIKKALKEIRFEKKKIGFVESGEIEIFL